MSNLTIMCPAVLDRAAAARHLYGWALNTMISFGRRHLLRAIGRFARVSWAIAPVAAVIVFLAHVPKAFGAETAEELALICTSIAGTSPASDGQLYFNQTFDNGRCWGAFAAVQALSRIKSAVDRPPLLGICAPTETTRRELVKVFIDYIAGHPELRTQDFSVVVIMALRRQYPCRNSE